MNDKEKQLQAAQSRILRDAAINRAIEEEAMAMGRYSADVGHDLALRNRDSIKQSAEQAQYRRNMRKGSSRWTEQDEEDYQRWIRWTKDREDELSHFKELRSAKRAMSPTRRRNQ